MHTLRNIDHSQNGVITIAGTTTFTITIAAMKGVTGQYHRTSGRPEPLLLPAAAVAVARWEPSRCGPSGDSKQQVMVSSGYAASQSARNAEHWSGDSVRNCNL